MGTYNITEVVLRNIPTEEQPESYICHVCDSNQIWGMDKITNKRYPLVPQKEVEDLEEKNKRLVLELEQTQTQPYSLQQHHLHNNLWMTQE